MSHWPNDHPQIYQGKILEILNISQNYRENVSNLQNMFHQGSSFIFVLLSKMHFFSQKYNVQESNTIFPSIKRDEPIVVEIMFKVHGKGQVMTIYNLSEILCDIHVITELSYQTLNIAML